MFPLGCQLRLVCWRHLTVRFSQHLQCSQLPWTRAGRGRSCGPHSSSGWWPMGWCSVSDWFSPKLLPFSTSRWPKRPGSPPFSRGRPCFQVFHSCRHFHVSRMTRRVVFSHFLFLWNVTSLRRTRQGRQFTHFRCLTDLMSVIECYTRSSQFKNNDRTLPTFLLICFSIVCNPHSMTWCHAN